MISRLGEDYKEEAVQFFKLMNASQRSDTDPLEPKPLTVLSFCLARESIKELDATAKRYKESWKDIMSDVQNMSRRLKSRTGGLLEVQLFSSKTPSPATKVGYLHRTVRDFLVTQEMKDLFQAETSFDADNALFNSCAYELDIGKTVFEKDAADEQALYNSAMLYAKRCQADAPKRNYVSQTRTLDQLYETMLPVNDRHGFGSIPYAEWSQSEKRICWAIDWGLLLYIRETLQVEDKFASPLVKRKLVDIALRTGLTSRPKILYELLTVGVDPLQGFDRSIVLDEALRLSSTPSHQSQYHPVAEAEERSDWLQVINYLQDYASGRRQTPKKKSRKSFRSFMCFKFSMSR
jgi:hypothetical protein